MIAKPRIATSHRGKEILHSLNILFDTHRNFSFFLTSSVSDLIERLGTIRPGPNRTVVDRLLLLLEQILEDELTPSAAACVQSPHQGPINIERRASRQLTDLTLAAVEAFYADSIGVGQQPRNAPLLLPIRRRVLLRPQLPARPMFKIRPTAVTRARWLPIDPTWPRPRDSLNLKTTRGIPLFVIQTKSSLLTSRT
jgi:hypothetical protein